jgi:uncharacterized membrane protein
MTIAGAGARWLVAGVVVSLCLNLFLIGLMAGHFIYGPGFGRGGPGAGPRHGMEAMINGLPEAVRPIFKEKFTAAKPQFDAARDQIRAARDKVAKAAEADPFDPAAYDAAFAELQTALNGVQKIAHQTIGEILPQIPADQRHKLVEQWEKRWDRFDHKP